MASIEEREETKHVEEFLKTLEGEKHDDRFAGLSEGSILIFRLRSPHPLLTTYNKDARLLFRIISKILSNEDDRYTEMKDGKIEYDWDNVFQDFKEAVSRNPNCTMEQKADGSTIFHILADNSNVLDGRLLMMCIDLNPLGLQTPNKFGWLPIQ